MIAEAIVYHHGASAIFIVVHTMMSAMKKINGGIVSTSLH